MNSNNFNLVSIEKFDEALNQVNSLSSCNISNAMSVLNGSGLSSGYAGISNGIADIKDSINRLADGAGPEGLIDNYKSGYVDIKNAIIESYIAEYELALENGNIMSDASSLKKLSEVEKNKYIIEMRDLLKNMSEKNSSSDTLLQYASLTEFFKEVENAFSKYSISTSVDASKLSNLSSIPTFDTPLIAPTGFIEYDRADGKRVKETWCQLKVSTLVSNMKEYEGIDLPYWIRDDGVRMYGPFTIVAGDVKSRVNPWTGTIAYKGGTCEYGDIVATSLGLGIIMDYGEDAVICREKSGGSLVRYETYTAWAEAPYNSMVYAPNYEPKNYAYNPQLIGNPNLGNLAKNPEILPEGWEKSINNPDCLKEVWNGVMKNCESISNSSGSSTGSSSPSTSVGSGTSGSSASSSKPSTSVGSGTSGSSASSSKPSTSVGSGTSGSSTGSSKPSTSVGSGTSGSSASSSKPSTSVGSGTSGSSASSSKPSISVGSGTSGSSASSSKPSTSVGSGTSGSSTSSSKPSTSVGSGTSGSSASSSKPSTSVGSGTSGSSASSSKPSTSVGLGTSGSSTGSSKPSTSVGSGTSGSSASSSKPSTSVGSGTSGSSTSSSSSSLNSSISNILPSNMFSNALPELKSGNLGSMEINQNSVNYEVHNVDDYIYSDYVKSLIDQGYTMTDYGTFIKGNYEVVTKITKDGNMSISLNII